MFLNVFLLLCGCQCSEFLPGNSMGWSVHTTPCRKSWLLCCVFLIVCLLSLGCQYSMFLPSGSMGSSVHTSPVEIAGCFV